MLRILKYVFFIPFGLIMGIFGGWLARIGSKFFLEVNIYNETVIDFFSWGFTGLFFSVLFFGNSYGMSPTRSENTKNLLMVFLAIIICVQMIWQYLNNEIIAGISFGIVACFSIIIIHGLDTHEYEIKMNEKK